MRSDEFPKGTLKHNNYVDCTKKVNIFNEYIIRSQSELCLETVSQDLELKREILSSHDEISFPVSGLYLYPEIESAEAH